ncbi:uncharacterized protein si:ch211-171b20.3 isoform X1 [Platichthys flesus]|uniref:uncharacterized protein si:ch211-171b20.3 isoform X1 n=1 Tax=Platichthys flesus TaxID=8260 RepID=UPI002DC05FA6|nr:uncharacterized protein si:ch211-171b20.3 isoform X1 [Platichthys flesus]
MAAPSMMTFQVNSSLPTTEALAALRGSNSCGPDTSAGHLAYRSLGMGAGGGRATFRQKLHMRRTLPVTQPLSKCVDEESFIGGLMFGGSPNMTKESENKDPEDVCGRHLLFDNKLTSGARFERTRSVIPPLLRDYHRPGALHPLSLSKELSHSHAGPPFTLGYPERYELNPSPAILLPSTLFLNGRNPFSVENCKLSRPKVNYPSYNNILTVRDNHTSQSFPDPVVGASRSFIQRISELSSLEAESARQEKLKKMRKLRKPPS